MSYRFDVDESAAEAVRRIADEQLGAARASLASADRGDTARAVHDCRKRCKKLRGLVRLVRPALGKQYKAVNAALRDAARELAPIRDARARLEAFRDLVAAVPAPAREDVRLQTVEQGLCADVDAAEGAVQQHSDRIRRARERLDAAGRLLSELTLDRDDPAAIRSGAKKTWKRGRSALAAVREAPDPARFHEWRKRAKYTWYHLKLLRDAAPTVLRPLAGSFKDLADLLGDAHDLVVIVDHLQQDPKRYGGSDAVQHVAGLAERAQRELEARALAIGRRLYVERADAFGRRLSGYWAIWHEAGAEPARAPIRELALDTDSDGPA
jgi:CHAD domain-containing protein